MEESDAHKIWIGAVLIVAFFAVLISIGYGLRVVDMRVDRVVMEESHQYQQGKLGALQTLANQHQSLVTEIATLRLQCANDPDCQSVIQGMEGQLETIESTMRTEAGKINWDKVPVYVKRIVQ